MRFAKHLFTAITIGLLGIVGYTFYFTGAYKDVKIGEDARGPYTLVYLEHSGPYNEISKKITAVETWAKEQNIDCHLTFGEYFDNPSNTEEGRLKSRGGCIIDNKNTEALEKLKAAKLPDAVRTAELPQANYVVALFEGAPSIGPMKVYPKIEKYLKEKNLKAKTNILEIYEVLGERSMQTSYLWPVEG